MEKIKSQYFYVFFSAIIFKQCCKFFHEICFGFIKFLNWTQLSVNNPKKTHKFICNLFYYGHFNGLFQKFPNCLGNQITYFSSIYSRYFFSNIRFSPVIVASCGISSFFFNHVNLSQTEKKITYCNRIRLFFEFVLWIF